MDGASRMFAVPSKIELGGKVYNATGRLAKHFGEMERYLLSKRPDPIKIAHDSMEALADMPAMQEKILELAAKEAFRARSVTDLEISEWMEGTDGKAFCVWLATREEYPGFESHEQIKALILDDIEDGVQRWMEKGMAEAEAQEEATAEVHDKIDDSLNEASGSDLAGNSTGPSTK